MRLKLLILCLDSESASPFFFQFFFFSFILFLSGCATPDPDEVTRDKSSSCFPGCCQQTPWIYMFPHPPPFASKGKGGSRICISGCKVFCTQSVSVCVSVCVSACVCVRVYVCPEGSLATDVKVIPLLFLSLQLIASLFIFPLLILVCFSFLPSPSFSLFYSTFLFCTGLCVFGMCHLSYFHYHAGMCLFISVLNSYLIINLSLSCSPYFFHHSLHIPLSPSFPSLSLQGLV